MSPVDIRKCGNIGFPGFHIHNGSIMSNFYCLGLNYTAQLSGCGSIGLTQWLNVQYNMCSQTQLDLMHPGENLTCVYDPKILFALMSNLEIQLLVQTTYFDSTSYSDQPIKNSSKIYVFHSGLSVDTSQFFTIRPNQLTLSDGIIASQFVDAKQASFYDVILAYTDVTDRDMTSKLDYARAY